MSRTFLHRAKEERDPALNGASSSPDSAFRLFSADELIALPAPKPLIKRLIALRSVAVLYGPSSAGKSFLAIHFACCVALGIPCLGKPTHQGPVVYIAAEGEEGIGLRLQAWKVAHNVDAIPGLAFLCDAVNILDEDLIDDFSDYLAELPEPPILIIVDTLARCMVGGDENSTKDMGIAVHALSRLRRRLGATILIIHHTGKKGVLERGNSSLRGGVDTMMSLVARDEGILLKNTKQKNAKRFRDLPLELAPVWLEEIDESCVIRKAHQHHGLNERRQRVLGWLKRRPRTFAALLEGLDMPESTLKHVLRFLVEEEYVVRESAQRGTPYLVTAIGAEALTASRREGKRGA